jgi:hypothetical protein
MVNYCPNCGEQNPATICVCGQVTNAAPLGFALAAIHKEATKPIAELPHHELVCIIDSIKTITSQVMDYGH